MWVGEGQGGGVTKKKNKSQVNIGKSIKFNSNMKTRSLIYPSPSPSLPFLTATLFPFLIFIRPIFTCMRVLCFYCDVIIDFFFINYTILQLEFISIDYRFWGFDNIFVTCFSCVWRGYKGNRVHSKLDYFGLFVHLSLYVIGAS